MLPRPWIWPSSFKSCCSWTELAVGLTDAGCCAETGATVATTNASARAPAMKRIFIISFTIATSPLNRNFLVAYIGGAGLFGPAPPAFRSGRDIFAIGRLPAPCTGAVAALGHPLLVDLGNHVAIAGKQRLGRAHFGAQGQLTFGEPVSTVFRVFFLAAVGFGSAGAERALVHLAARTEVADLGILRRAKWASIEAIATTDA